MSICLNIMLLKLQSEQGTWYLKCVWLLDCYYLLVIIKVGFMGEGGQSCSLSSCIIVVVVISLVCLNSVMLQVLVNYSRSSKEAEEVSKEVCSLFLFLFVFLFRSLCVSIYIFLGFLSQSLIAYKFQPPWFVAVCTYCCFSDLDMSDYLL